MEDQQNDYTSNQIACRIQFFYDLLREMSLGFKQDIREPDMEEIQKENIQMAIEVTDSLVNEFFDLFNEILVNK